MPEKEPIKISQETGVAAPTPGALTTLLRVTGPDALDFLQGQFTQELRPGRAPDVAYGLWLNQKGRVLADSHVLRIGPEEWWVVSTSSGAGVVRERLEAYLIADDVVIEDLLPGWAGQVIAGEAARAWFGREGATPPRPGQLERWSGSYAFVGRRGLPDTWEVLQPVGATELPPELTITPVELERARINAAIPAVPRDLGPTDLPQEAGLDQVAISFTKGCYLGQEVMARLNAMGRVRRRLLRVVGPNAVPPTSGAALYQDAKVVGELRSAVDDGAGGWVGLAMFSLVNLNAAGPVSLEANGNATITLTVEPSAS